MSGKTPEVVGPYLVYEEIGRGGMATVHRAETQGLDGFRRPVALKRLHPQLTTDAELVKSFIHEARLASHLHHTNVAQTYDLGKVDDSYFIAMEYVPGATLAQIIRQCNAAAGLIPIPVALDLVMQVLDGLDHAHHLCDDGGKPLGLVHRDVSPANIIVSNTGIVKLIDFGIAKARSSGVVTQAGMIKGKFGYVAPEYTRGQLDARCDLFAVGIVAHELLTGRRLFDGNHDLHTVMLVREGPIQPPSRWRPEVPRELDDILMTALQRDPTLRWQSAAAMRTALGNFARDAKLEVTNQQVLEWVEWAFSREARVEDSGLVRVIDQLDEPSSVSVEIAIDQLDELEAKTTVRPSASAAVAAPPADVASTPPPGHPAERQPHASTTKRQGSRTGRWLLVVLLLVLAAAGAVIAADALGYELDRAALS